MELSGNEYWIAKGNILLKLIKNPFSVYKKQFMITGCDLNHVISI